MRNLRIASTLFRLLMGCLEDILRLVCSLSFHDRSMSAIRVETQAAHILGCFERPEEYTRAKRIEEPQILEQSMLAKGTVLFW